MATANITVHLGDDFIQKLAAEIVRQQMGGETVSQQTPAPAAGGSWPSQPQYAGEDAEDPWGAPSGPPATATAPSGGYSAAPSPAQAASPHPAGPQGPTVLPGKNGQTYTFGLPNAPACECGQQAALRQGSTNGKPWKQWVCAKSHSDWRNKCQFAQFTR